MRLKYKKLILLLTMGVMGIGMLTISFDKASTTDSNALQASSSDVLAIKEGDITPTIVPPLMNTPTIVPEDPLKLKLNQDIQINELVKTYYKAKIEIDEETLNSIVTENSIIDITIISKTLEYISGFHNIVCYTKPGVKEGDYVVYVSFDMEIASIDTYAPALDRLYITTIDNKLYLRFEKKNDEIDALLKEYLQSEDVLELKQSVDQALLDACAKDEELKEFYDNLNASIKAKPTTTEPSE